MSDSAPATDEVEPDAAPAEEARPEMLHGVPVTTSADMQVLHPGRDELVATIEALRGDGFVMCLDVTAVDYLTHPGRDLPAGIDAERFELVVTLISHVAASRIRVRVQVPADDAVVPSLFEQFPGTEALEREVFDMFGITFDGHPDLSRILMPEDWDGHPLRKDYGIGRVPVQFKGAPQ